MDLSTYLEGKIAAWLRGSAMGSAPASLTFGLSNGDPLDDASGLVEPTHGYARQAIVFTAVISDTSQSAMSNNAGIVFTPTSGQAFGMVTHGCVFDNSGNLLFSGPLGAPGAYGVDSPISFAINTVVVGLGSGFGKFLAEAVLNWARGASMPTAPTSVYLVLSLQDPGFDTTGLEEPTQNGYQAQLFAFAAPTVDDGTTLRNDAPIMFGPCTRVRWGFLTHWAVRANSPDGAPLCYGRFTTPKEVNIGGGFGLQTGALALLIQ